MTYFIGIDPGSRVAGIAALHGNGMPTTDLLTPAGRELSHRLCDLRRRARAWLAPFADHGVLCAVIEQPGTRHGGAALLASYGVLLEAVRSMLPDAIVIEMPSGQWKLHALGNGAAKKRDVMAFARHVGYMGVSQDEADALGCAYAARARADRIEVAA